MSRGRKRVGFIGGTERGKSTQVEKMVLHRHTKFGEPVIILDPNRQVKWYKYPEINFEMLTKMKKGIYRICTMEYEKFFKIIFDNFRGGQVVCEDSSNYLTSQKNDKIYPNLIGLRHPGHDVDITFITHSVYRTPKYLVEQLNEVILFKTGDTWKSCEDRIPDEHKEKFKEAFMRVNAHQNQFYWERIVLAKTGTK